MIEDLKWYLIKNKMIKANDIKVEKEEIEKYAEKMAKIQFAQYGMMNVPQEILENYTKDMLKKPETAKNIAEKVVEDKVVEIVKQSVKLNHQSITVEEFNKMFA